MIVYKKKRVKIYPTLSPINVTPYRPLKESEKKKEMAQRNSSNRGRKTQKRRGVDRDSASPPAGETATVGRARGRDSARAGRSEGTRGGGGRAGRREEEMKDVAPRHEQMERGVTRLGKMAQDRRESIIGDGDRQQETAGGSTEKSSGPDSTESRKRSSPVRKSRAVERGGTEDEDDRGISRCASPGRNLVVVQASPGSNVAARSVRSSFQTAQGSPASVTSAARGASPSTPRDLYDEEEEESVEDRATLRQLRPLGERSREGVRDETCEVGSSENLSPGASSGGSPGSRGKGNDEEGGAGGGVSSRGCERKDGRSSEEEVEEGNKGDKDGEGGDSEISEESSSSEEDSSASGSSSSPSPKTRKSAVVRLSRAIYCKKEIGR